MRQATHSLRWRLTLWYSLALGILLAASAAGSWYTLRRVLADRADRFLVDARDAFLVELAAERATWPAASDAIGAAMRDIRFPDIEFVVLDSSRRVVATSWSPPRRARPAPAVAGARLSPDRLARHLAATPRPPASDEATGETSGETSAPVTGFVTLPGPDGGHRVATGEVTLDGAPYIVAASQARRWLHETLDAVTLAYVAAIPLVLLLAAGGGYLLAGRALAPVAAMGRRARGIEAHSLHERLPVEDPHDELGRLATVINDLLARLEDAFAQQRRLVADASHELRTPVAVVRAEADVALSQPTRPAAEYREALAVIQGAGRRMSRIVDDLFLLARADGGRVPLRREPLYLDELVDDTVRVLRSLAAERGVRMEVAAAPELPVHGDPDLLGRLVSNLLENAVKYSAAGSLVTLRLGRSGDSALLAVADTGPGIPPAARSRVFERFFRASDAPPEDAPPEDAPPGVAAPHDAARHDAAPAPETPAAPGGAGLGLAIARWVAEAHGGSLELVRSSPEGSEFRVTLPLDPAPAVAPLATPGGATLR